MQAGQQSTLSIVSTLLNNTMSTTETNEQGDDRSSSTEVEAQQRPRRGGKGGHHRREDPTSLVELQACPMVVNCFRYMSCFQFCERLAVGKELGFLDRFTWRN